MGSIPRGQYWGSKPRVETVKPRVKSRGQNEEYGLPRRNREGAAGFLSFGRTKPINMQENNSLQKAGMWEPAGGAFFFFPSENRATL
jgi:hypothetical protein